MVKGVSKTVIVVNNTGNKYFEKIVFYVTPEYGNLSAGHLNSAAAKFVSTFEYNKSDKTFSQNKSLRKRYKRKRFFRFLTVSAIALAIIGIILAVIL